MQYLNNKKMSQCDFVIMNFANYWYLDVLKTNFNVFDVLAFRSIRLDETNFLL